MLYAKSARNKAKLICNNVKSCVIIQVFIPFPPNLRLPLEWPLSKRWPERRGYLARLIAGLEKDFQVLVYCIGR
jgi:hypothetical protein